MKRILYIIFPAIIAGMNLLSCTSGEKDELSPNFEELRALHAEFLKDTPMKANTKLSRKDRIRQALPPNQYYEQMAYLTMNPALGYPEPYKVREIQKKLAAQRAAKAVQKAPGEQGEDPWTLRGPNNVGGRTRVVFFDPNDASGQRAYAGAVSGGLWVNEDITNEQSPWEQVEEIPANLNISCITVDPRDVNTWYLGTGEQYTAGDVVGTGVYKTTDAGETWIKVLDVEDFATGGTGENARVVGGVHYINDIIAWDNGTSTEIFLGVSTHIYADAANPTNFLGFFDRGLYNSTNAGESWTKLIEDKSFNDLEKDADGNLWVATTYSPGEGCGSRGGDIYRRNKGDNTAFELITTIPEVQRTEIEPSSTDPLKFYILAERVISTGDDACDYDSEAEMWITTDAFNSITSLNEPDDADLNIPPNDFARGQAFFNLLIEADPTDDNIVYAGGINLFRSTNSGQSWNQISKWSNNNNLGDLPVSLVHADQHAMQFRPDNTNQAIFGHDGGVSFARDLAAASSADVIITPERDYVTTQFYSVGVAPVSFATGDFFLGGTQDNGTQLIQNGNRNSIGVLGGDGAHSFFDQINTEYFIANIVYNNLIVAYNYDEDTDKMVGSNDIDNFSVIANNEDRDGFFINPQALDSNLDKLYSNGPEGILYRYDNIGNIGTVGNNGVTDDDPVAPRVSLTNARLDASMSALEVSPYTTGSTTLLVGLVNGKLLKIEDAHGSPTSVTWTSITGPQFVGSISDIEFGLSEEEIYVTFYNYGVRSVWYTENGTATNPTWMNKEGNLPDLPVLAILRNPGNEDEVIVGTELGVWATQNFTESNPRWEQAYNGMSDVKVTDLDLKRGSNTVFAASYGRGIFSGQFSGEIIDPNQPRLPENELVVYPTISSGNYNILSGSSLGDAQISVFDLLGQLVYSTNIEVGENIPVGIQLAKEASGVYFMRIESSGNTFLQKIVKK